MSAAGFDYFVIEGMRLPSTDHEDGRLKDEVHPVFVRALFGLMRADFYNIPLSLAEYRTFARITTSVPTNVAIGKMRRGVGLRRMKGHQEEAEFGEMRADWANARSAFAHRNAFKGKVASLVAAVADSTIGPASLREISERFRERSMDLNDTSQPRSNHRTSPLPQWHSALRHLSLLSTH
jgi:hypothetical protein